MISTRLHTVGVESITPDGYLYRPGYQYHVESTRDILGEELVGLVSDVVRLCDMDDNLRTVSGDDILRRDSFVMRNDAGIIGFVSLQEIVEYNSRQYRQISTLLVLPIFAGKGLAKKLVYTAREAAGTDTFAHIKGDDLGKAKAFMDNGFVAGEMPYEGVNRPALLFHREGLAS